MADAPPFPLLPSSDDEFLSPQADLDAAAASALAAASVVEIPVAEPEPLGSTILIDFDTMRMVERGGSPVWVTGIDALIVWCLSALHTARFAHASLSDEVGMEGPEDPIGEVVVGPLLADYERRLREALLVHDRITAVEDYDATYDPVAGVLTINSFTVVLDDDEPVSISPNMPLTITEGES